MIDNKEELTSFLSAFSQIPEKKILVHGGGKIATQIGNKLDIAPNYHEGRRITDDDTIDLVTMVYGGLVNKRIVAQINANGADAIGLTGADANLILAHRRPMQNDIDFGWVGDIESVNMDFLENTLKQNMIPVLAPLTADREGHILNTNADTIASAVAAELSVRFETQLIYCFEKVGVLKDVDDPESIIQEINLESFEAIRSSGSVHSGMLPKMSNSFDALKRGVEQVIIGHSKYIKQLTQSNFENCTRINL